MRLIDSKPRLDRLASLQAASESLSLLYNACISRATLGTLRAKTGRVLLSANPDISSGMATALLHDRFLTVDLPLTIAAASAGSNGSSAFVSNAWLQSGWDAKHVYTFTWLGRPIIQLPEDMIRLQEVIFRVKPDVIIETGVAHGGSLVYGASMLRILHPDRFRQVIGVDIEIRPHNRNAIEEHFLFDDITLIEGMANSNCYRMICF